MAKKKKIKLGEEKKEKLISLVLEHLLGNIEKKMAFDVKASDIPIEDLRQGYKDFRLVPTPTCYGHILYTPHTLKEAFGDSMPPDEVVENIIRKYELPPSFVKKKEAYNKIYIYVIIAAVGNNCSIIEEDMCKMGYFIGLRGKIEDIDGMKFQTLQFEPLSQIQNDETESIKSENKFLYHWTPAYCLEWIFENGLLPSHKNSVFNYPPRTYLIKSKCSNRYLSGLGQLLCSSNKNHQNDGEYALLKINIENLDNTIRFYLDSNSEFGIYTEQPIPKEKIELVSKATFLKL